jgi:hypothetical protein
VDQSKLEPEINRPISKKEVWEHPPETRPPSVQDFAYLFNGQTVGTDKAGLIRMVQQHGAEVRWVWTPASPSAVTIDQVDFLLPAYKKHLDKIFNKQIVIGLLFLALFLLPSLFGSGRESFLAALLVVPL